MASRTRLYLRRLDVDLFQAVAEEFIFISFLNLSLALNALSVLEFRMEQTGMRSGTPGAANMRPVRCEFLFY